MTSKPTIRVTEPSLPPLDSFLPYLEEIWDSKWVTNGGPFHARFEASLCEYLGVEHLSLVGNGTLGLVIALKALGVSGEVITTPYSFVATGHSLLWNNLTPKFVDIQSGTMNVDPDLIEAAITPQTKAILAVHCYGNPCDTNKIQEIADRNGLIVIYDAAHAFGVELNDTNLLAAGNASVLSFHGTKAFNTFEGGAVICDSAETKKAIDDAKNFGFVDEVTVNATGINGKLNEFSCALGLLQLERFELIREQRKAIDSLYRDLLKDTPLKLFEYDVRVNNPNYTYFPVMVEEFRDNLYDYLREQGVWARRYFYPLISEFPMYSDFREGTDLKAAQSIADSILCLPIHAELSEDEVTWICELIRTWLNR